MPGHEQEALTVSAVAKYLAAIISQNLQTLWIRGEVSNLKTQPNGNTYFSIKDQDSKLGAIVMANSRARKFVPDLKNGQEILIYGRVSYYKKEGYVSVFVEDMEFLGQGLLKQKFDELKKKLELEGLFDRGRKKPIPEYPEWVGVVTSPTGAAIQDILNVTNRRLSSVNLVVFPAAVQGEQASREIAQAIRIANQYGRNLIDVLIVGRGGGSVEDLWCFNEEIVARAIAASKIPVISAVGHEIDYTIADYVADLRAPTPSAAAELVVRDREALRQKIGKLTETLERSVRDRLNAAREFLKLRGREYFEQHRRTLREQLVLTLDNVQIRFGNALGGLLKNVRHRAGLLREKLETLSPSGILQRGYSVTYRVGPDGEKTCLKSRKAVQKGESLRTLLSDGEIDSIVQ